VLDQTGEELHQIRELINGVSVGRSSGAFLAEADILIKQAANLMKAGEFEKAKAAALQATMKVGSVQNRANRALTRLQSKDLLARWAQWVENTVSWSRNNNSNSVVVDKSRHVCMIFRAGKLVRNFPVNLGVNGFSQKIASGDLATPEGQYYVIRKQGVGQSRYYKGLMLNYPNEQDRQRFQQAKSDRQISAAARIGGNIMLHGEGGKDKDWTLGCVALANQDMDALFDLVQVNTPVTIVGRVSGRFSLMGNETHDIVEKTKELQSKKKQLRLL
jgi:L,D-peptidoglycan transpeptidase YkuD (ErfK/YbiS/YcfS/YnhG family)